MTLTGGFLVATGAESAERPNPSCGGDMRATSMTEGEDDRKGSGSSIGLVAEPAIGPCVSSP